MTQVYPTVTPPADFFAESYGALPTPLPDAETRLHHLTQALFDDLELLDYPHRTWNYSCDADLLNVAIVGGGHTGKSAAFGLRRHGITNIRVFDRSPAGLEGPWRTYARNATLRTPKIVTGGLDWGIPNLNVRRWCDARYGEEYWHSITYIPRLLWAEYLEWYGNVLELPIQNNTDIQTITWDAAQHCFLLHSAQTSYKARFIILATGMECAGGKSIPPIVTEQLPPSCYVHTMDLPDVASLAGKRIVILGGGASAFDTAIAALNAGAEQVDIVIRRAKLPNLNRVRWSEWNGYHRHYIDLPDALKWYYSLEEFRLGQLPPPHTYYEAMRRPNLTLYTDAPVQQLAYKAGKIEGLYGDRTLYHDLLICGTGFCTDLSQQPELSTFADQIARWKDRYQPEPGSGHAELEQYPYLGKNLELTPKHPEHDYLRRCYYLSSGAALLSGFRANLSGLQFALPRVLYDIGRQLFLEHQDEIRADFDRYDILEY
jgi:cation diffusion facilitator CzcD-associated flavoprotein CzcO